jgi:hypothetical protein
MSPDPRSAVRESEDLIVRDAGMASGSFRPIHGATRNSSARPDRGLDKRKARCTLRRARISILVLRPSEDRLISRPQIKNGSFADLRFVMEVL